MATLSPQRFAEAYKADPYAIVVEVKRGIEPAMVGTLATSMKMSKEKLYATLGLPRATMQRKVAQDKRLSPEESSRVLGMTRLIGQVQAMVAESGEPEGFDAAAWVAEWLDQELPALNGHRPAEYMDTAEGQALVSQILARMQSGSYA
ncbi:MAG: DUF2384 domain-containing protein [Acidovorax sp.]|uniref:type II RES/Xre toxin-antitoxin system antitoxin n=1 Tax=Acidovorax sp. TaxID=1872122 RepID=UPI0039E24668